MIRGYLIPHKQLGIISTTETNHLIIIRKTVAFNSESQAKLHNIFCLPTYVFQASKVEK
jgi:hypothetical protein